MIVSHSQLDKFRVCHWVYYVKYVLGLEPDREDDLARRLGSFAHDVYQAVGSGAAPDVHAAALALIDASPWIGEEHEFVSILAVLEARQQLGLIRPEIKDIEKQFMLRLAPEIMVTGYTDGTLPTGDLIEFKTTGQDLGQYFRFALKSLQLPIYALATGRLTITLDVTRRPALRPKSECKTRKAGEPMAEFGDRVKAVVMAEPDKYFQSRRVQLLACDIERARAEVIQTANEIWRCNEAGVWPRSASWATCPRCAYEGLCEVNYSGGEFAPPGYKLEEREGRHGISKNQ